MENILNITETYDTPGIIFDSPKNIFEISGRSLPENTKEFYAPVMQWLSEYVKKPNKETLFTFKLDYLNSSSTRKIIEMIFLLQNIKP